VPGLSGEARHHEILRDSDDEQRESPESGQNESCENENVECACELVAWVFPLSQSELQDPTESNQGTIETGIVSGSDERHQSLRHEVNEAGNSQGMDGQK